MQRGNPDDWVWINHMTPPKPQYTKQDKTKNTAHILDLYSVF